MALIATEDAVRIAAGTHPDPFGVLGPHQHGGISVVRAFHPEADAAEVIDESFRGKNRVQQQRMVYASLKGAMDGPNGALHALALTTRAPE